MIAKGTGTSKKEQVYSVMSKLTTLHVDHDFCKFLCRPCTTIMLNGQIVCSLENGKTINSTISF